MWFEGKAAPTQQTAVHVELIEAPRSVFEGSESRAQLPALQHGPEPETSGEHRSIATPRDTNAASANTSAFVVIVRRRSIGALWPQR